MKLWGAISLLWATLYAADGDIYRHLVCIRFLPTKYPRDTPSDPGAGPEDTSGPQPS